VYRITTSRLFFFQLDRTRGEVILEKRVEVLDVPRRGAAAADATVQPRCDQVIHVTHQARSNPASYIVTQGALRLESDRLFLRQPGPGERGCHSRYPESANICSGCLGSDCRSFFRFVKCRCTYHLLLQYSMRAPGSHWLTA
jgi:hypothetical protein